jgi:hypothetical protein
MHDPGHGYFHFLGHRGQFGIGKHTQKGGGPDGGDLGYALGLVDRDPAGQGGGDGDIVFQDLLGLPGIANFKHQARRRKWHPLVVKLLPDIDGSQDAELVAGADLWKDLGDFLNRFAALHYYQHCHALRFSACFLQWSSRWAHRHGYPGANQTISIFWPM